MIPASVSVTIVMNDFVVSVVMSVMNIVVVVDGNMDVMLLVVMTVMSVDVVPGHSE